MYSSRLRSRRGSRSGCWRASSFSVDGRARYCLILVLLFGGALAVALGLTNFASVSFHLTRPVFTMPTWTWQSTVSLAVPLVIVSLTGQFLPGFAILRASGYHDADASCARRDGLASMLVAFSGGITIVIAAITAALCTGPDAHRDPERRYVAGIANGLFYLVGGCFAGTVVMLFAALPNAFVAVLAGSCVARRDRGEHRRAGAGRGASRSVVHHVHRHGVQHEFSGAGFGVLGDRARHAGASGARKCQAYTLRIASVLRALPSQIRPMKDG